MDKFIEIRRVIYQFGSSYKQVDLTLIQKESMAEHVWVPEKVIEVSIPTTHVREIINALEDALKEAEKPITE